MSLFKKAAESSKTPTNWRLLIFNALVLLCTLLTVGTIGKVFEYFHFDNFVEDLELKTYDLRTAVTLGTPKTRPSDQIVIVKFDNLTLNLYETDYGTWPWPREVHAELIEFLNQCGVRMIGYDIMFVAHQKGQETSDQILYETFKKHKNVYFGMNFDNDLEVFRDAGKDLTPEDVDRIRPLSIPVALALDSSNNALSLDGTGFYRNPAMSFIHFRSLMPELMSVGERIAFLNHSRDQDSISRGNPLFFRFIYQKPVKTEALPLHQTEDGKHWRDSKNRPVSADGTLLRPNGQPVTRLEYTFYPYMAMRMLFDLKYPGQKLILNLTPDGRLRFGQHDVPLFKNGNYLIHWHNTNYAKEAARRFIEQKGPQIEAFQQKLATHPDMRTPENIRLLTHGLNELKRSRQILENIYLSAAPYAEVSVSRILTAIYHQKEGKLTQQDRELMRGLRNKIIFVGTTAMSTYDIKSSPINPAMPGVVVQAHVFDNLMQNNFYVVRLTPFQNLMITFLISILAAFTTYKMSSANAGFLAAVCIATVYVMISAFLFKEHGLWMNVVMPMIVLTITVTITYMLKYISRDKDYRRTYALATTDSMTGLYNHRYFQEYMLKSIEQAKRYSQKFSLVLIDIDFFKKFNDTYGHQAGDEVLRCVARKLKACVRSVDVVARYGGEEMAVILDRATEQEALDVAWKLVHEVAAEAYPIAEGVAKHVTISVGVSTYPTHGETPAELIEFSDQGLYRAKEGGRNRVGAQYDEDMPKTENHELHPPQAGEPPAPGHDDHHGPHAASA